MFHKKTRSSLILGLGATALFSTLAAIGMLAACSPTQTASINPAPVVAQSGTSAQAPRYRVVPPDNKPFARTETVLGSQRIKGRIQTMQDSELNVQVSDYSFELGTDSDGDGAANERAEGQLEIAGLGKHQVVLEQENYPVMSNQQDQLTVKDETSGNTRTYTADQDLFNYSVSDGTNSLSVKALPDGSWTVNGETAATPEEVAELAMKSPLLANASAHGLIMMYETFNQAHKVPVEYLETLAPIRCTTSSGGVNAATSFGDPEPLLKEVIKLKLKQK